MAATCVDNLHGRMKLNFSCLSKSPKCDVPELWWQWVCRQP